MCIRDRPYLRPARLDPLRARPGRRGPGPRPLAGWRDRALDEGDRGPVRRHRARGHPGHALAARGQLTAGRQGVTWVAPRSMTTNWSAVTFIQGPVSPSGQWTRTWASPAGPSPKWVQPSWPEI